MAPSAHVRRMMAEVFPKHDRPHKHRWALEGDSGAACLDCGKRGKEDWATYDWHGRPLRPRPELGPSSCRPPYKRHDWGELNYQPVWVARRGADRYELENCREGRHRLCQVCRRCGVPDR